MTRDELLATLTAERYNGGGWTAPEPLPEPPDDLVTAKRRRAMDDDFRRMERGVA